MIADLASHHHPGCPPVCVHRVIARNHRAEMARYRAKPMPSCTWIPESGPVTLHSPEFSGPRYRVVNGSSGAGGKFQFLPSTWRAIGGRGLPEFATPRLQERMARKLMALQGLSPWTNC